MTRTNNIINILNSGDSLATIKEKAITEISQLQADYEYYKRKDVERNSRSIEALEDTLAEYVESEWLDIIGSDCISDRLHEFVEDFIPIYNYDLACYLANDASLASVDDSGLIDGVTDIFQIIGVSIYERLTATVYEKVKELKDERIPHYEYMLDKHTNYIDKLETMQESDEVSADQHHALQVRINASDDKQQYFTTLLDNLDQF